MGKERDMPVARSQVGARQTDTGGSSEGKIYRSKEK